MIYVQALLALLPIIKTLMGTWINTPAQDREALIVSLSDAFKKANETKDSSGIEDVLRRGGR